MLAGKNIYRVKFSIIHDVVPRDIKPYFRVHGLRNTAETCCYNYEINSVTTSIITPQYTKFHVLQFSHQYVLRECRKQ